jgi:hypothetical protein
MDVVEIIGFHRAQSWKQWMLENDTRCDRPFDQKEA